ncbi:hypothetical protein E2320_016962 [Naja naja]|nr:hypothetical protein E2320_016962 [Naja naja]
MRGFAIIHTFPLSLTAERRRSLGKDYHPLCLKCYHCKRQLTPGQHAEHDDKPYCTHCYLQRFGPREVEMKSLCAMQKRGVDDLEQEQDLQDCVHPLVLLLLPEFQHKSENPALCLAFVRLQK